MNQLLSKVTGVRKRSDGSYVWHDGSELDPAKRPKGLRPPPLLTEFKLPEGVTPYFDGLRHHANWPAKNFTEPGKPGEIYRPIFDEMVNLMRWEHASHDLLAPRGFHFLVPSFLHTLHELVRQGRDFALVVRSFGMNIPEVATALRAYSAGEHPEFTKSAANTEGMNKMHLDDANACWCLWRENRQDIQTAVSLRRYEADIGKYGYGPVPGMEAKLPKSVLPKKDIKVDQWKVVDRKNSESTTYDFLASSSVLGIRDDYFFWKCHKCVPLAGKPLWITADDASVQHILFDDGIHDKDNNSIVAVRARRSRADAFHAVSGEKTRQLEGTLIVRAQMVHAIRERDYFLKKIDRCEERFERMRVSGSLWDALS